MEGVEGARGDGGGGGLNGIGAQTEDGCSYIHYSLLYLI